MSLHGHARPSRRQLPSVSPRLTLTRAVADLAVQLLATRVGHARRGLETANRILTQLRSLSTSGPLSSTGSREEATQTLAQRGGALADTICAERCYMEANGGRDAAYTFDPRFLAFEYAFNLLLRKQQADLIGAFTRAARGGESRVHQMIMGAGKTTVVCPLLALMLGNRGTLVMQVVPVALLEFSRSVMRERFSSLLRKPVYTFQFDRFVAASPALLGKILHARRLSAVMITSPTSLKSLVLKFIELVHMLEHSSTQDEEDYLRSHNTAAGMLRQLGRGLAVQALKRTTSEHSVVRGQAMVPQLAAQARIAVSIVRELQQSLLILDEVPTRPARPIHPCPPLALLSTPSRALRAAPSLLYCARRHAGGLDPAPAKVGAELATGQAQAARFRHEPLGSPLPSLRCPLLLLRWCDARFVAWGPCRQGAFPPPLSPASLPDLAHVPHVILLDLRPNLPDLAHVPHVKTACVRAGQAVLDRLHASVAVGLEEKHVQRTPHLILISNAFYRDALKPLLCRWMLLLLRRLRLRDLKDEQARAARRRVHALVLAHLARLSLSLVAAIFGAPCSPMPVQSHALVRAGARLPDVRRPCARLDDRACRGHPQRQAHQNAQSGPRLDRPAAATCAVQGACLTCTAWQGTLIPVRSLPRDHNRAAALRVPRSTASTTASYQSHSSAPPSTSPRRAGCSPCPSWARTCPQRHPSSQTQT